MVRISRLSFSAIIILGCFFLLTGVTLAGDAVSFSGVVKKVSPGKNKVGIKGTLWQFLKYTENAEQKLRFGTPTNFLYFFQKKRPAIFNRIIIPPKNKSELS